ncbi:MAG: GrpB family protein [Candidatus Paceibacterota bacterium]
MLTPEQAKWIAHLSDEDKIKIIPFDHTVEEKFQKVKQRIQKILGKEIPVEHHGATSLGISGQDEIDVYIPISSDKFSSLINELKNIFGEPKSLYPLERARFVTEEDRKHIDVFLINREHYGWNNMIRFEAYLKSNSQALEDYKKLKEYGNELSVREYYRRKIEFINEVLSCC